VSHGAATYEGGCEETSLGDSGFVSEGFQEPPNGHDQVAEHQPWADDGAFAMNDTHDIVL